MDSLESRRAWDRFPWQDRRRPARWRAGTLVLVGLVLAGCGGSRQYLAAQPLPVEVTPADPAWELTVGLELAEAIRVQLVNHGTEPVSLLWGDSTYIDIEQRSHPIVPRGMAAGPQTRWTVAPGTQLDEVFMPVTGLSSALGDPLVSRPTTTRRWWWPFGTRTPATRLGQALDPAKPLVGGQQVGVFLVLERAGQRKHLLAKYRLVGQASPMGMTAALPQS